MAFDAVAYIDFGGFRERCGECYGAALASAFHVDVLVPILQSTKVREVRWKAVEANPREPSIKQV